MRTRPHAGEPAQGAVRDSGPTNLRAGFPWGAKSRRDLIPVRCVPPWQRPWTQDDRRMRARGRSGGGVHRLQASRVVGRPIAQEVVRDPQEMAGHRDHRDLAPPARSLDAEPDRLQRRSLRSATPTEQHMNRLHQRRAQRRRPLCQGSADLTALPAAPGGGHRRWLSWQATLARANRSSRKQSATRLRDKRGSMSRFCPSASRPGGRVS